jgi:ribosomal protein S12 methylthiotransferase accessory factor
VAPQELPAPFAVLASRWQELGVALAVRHVPNALDLPCFEAVLHQPDSDDVNLASGSGLHLDRELALARAICEAAQSRLSHIHGGRDDITNFYAKYTEVDKATRREREAAAVAKAFDSQRRVAFAALPQVLGPAGSARAALDDLLARVSAAGFKAVMRHHFEAELGGLHVVKVVVPGCEEVESLSRRIGPRLFERITANV